MSSLDRPLSGGVLLFDLAGEDATARSSPALERSGRTARTLVKEGPLRITLVVLGPGGEMAEHQAQGPITVRPVVGRITFRTEHGAHEVGVGQLLTAEGGLPHSVHSDAGATFLLTVVDG